MLCHVGQHTLFVLQEADMAQLVHLIIADDHHGEALADILHGVHAACNGGNTCTGEGNLAGGGEHEHTVLRAVLLALVQQNRGLDDLLGQVFVVVFEVERVLDRETAADGRCMPHPRRS